MVDAQETQNAAPKLYRCAGWIESGKKLYLDAETADVHFALGWENDNTFKVIPAHKNILAAASDVFRTMIYGEKSTVQGCIHVDDVSEGAFKEFLQFFYRTQIRLSIENVAGVMQLGHKYNVPNCIKICVEFLKDVLTVHNVFIGLNLGIRHNLSDLLKFCSKFITLNTAAVFKSAGFLECDKPALEFILKMDLFSCSEVETFQACMAWVESKSKPSALTKAMVKKHLGDLYHEIRYTSMTMPELCALQVDYEPVLRNDFPTITNMIISPEFQAENFNNQPRHAKWNNDANAVVVCDFNVKNSNESPQNLWNKHTITFSTTEIPLLLGRFVCGKLQVKVRGGFRDLSVALRVKVEILEVRDSNSASAKELLTMKAKLQSMDTTNEVVLPHPILIRPGFQYKICIGPFPDEHVYYSNELKTQVPVPNDCNWIPFYAPSVKFHNSSKDNRKTVGLIPVLKFNRL